MHPLPVFTKKSSGKIATTGYVNKVADFAAAMGETIMTGAGDGSPTSEDVGFFIITAQLGDNWYMGTTKNRPTILTVSDSEPAIQMTDGPQVLIFSGSTLSVGDFTAAGLLGFDIELGATIYGALGSGGSGELIPVDLSAPSTGSAGSAGDATTQCDFHYRAVHMITGKVMSENCVMRGNGKRDIVGQMSRGSEGWGVDLSTGFVLLFADETNDYEICTTNQTAVLTEEPDDPIPAGTLVLYDTATIGAFGVDLDPAPSVNDQVIFKNKTTSANNFTISGNGNNIDGAGTLVLSAGRASAILVFDGTEWIVL
jgi:hypothetical protein